MAKPSKGTIARKASYNGSLGAALDEVGFKSLGRRIKIRTGVSTLERIRKPAGQARRQD